MQSLPVQSCINDYPSVEQESCFLVGHTMRMPSALASSPAQATNAELYQASNYQLAVSIFGPGCLYENKNRTTGKDLFALMLI